MDTFNFDFDKVDPVALEETLAYFREHPDPPSDDFGFQAMLDDALLWGDRMGGMQMQTGSVGESGPQRHPTSAVQTQSLPRMLSKNSSQKLVFCTWEGCEISEASESKLVGHLLDHAQDAKGQWTHGSKCTWSGCNSRASFKLEKQYDGHLRNIHTHPLLCDHVGCTFKKPFRNSCDLGRHNSTAHTRKPNFECSYDSCPATIKTFIRKDKWLAHIRETEHKGDLLCPRYHCSLEQLLGRTWSLMNREDITTHFSLYHSFAEQIRFAKHEYYLGSCATVPHRDKWDFWSLCTHLECKHSLSWVAGGRMSFRLSLSEGSDEDSGATYILHANHEAMKYVQSWEDCTLCSRSDQLNQGPQMDGTTANDA